MPTDPNKDIASGVAAASKEAMEVPANVTLVFDRPIVLRILAPDVKAEIIDPHGFH